MALFDRSEEELILEDADLPLLATALELFTDDIIVTYARLNNQETLRPTQELVRNAARTAHDVIINAFRDGEMVDRLAVIAVNLVLGAAGLRAYLELARSFGLAQAEGVQNVRTQQGGGDPEQGLEPVAGPTGGDDGPVEEPAPAGPGDGEGDPEAPGGEPGAGGPEPEPESGDPGQPEPDPPLAGHQLGDWEVSEGWRTGSSHSGQAANPHTESPAGVEPEKGEPRGRFFDTIDENPRQGSD